MQKTISTNVAIIVIVLASLFMLWFFVNKIKEISSNNLQSELETVDGVVILEGDSQEVLDQVIEEVLFDSQSASVSVPTSLDEAKNQLKQIDTEQLDELEL